MNDEEKKKYYDQIVASWRLFLKYSDITIADEEKWEGLIRECDELYKQYKTEFIRKLDTIMIAEIEDRAKNREGNKNVKMG